MKVNKGNLVAFNEVHVVLRNDKEFVFKPNKELMEDGIILKNCFSIRSEYVSSKLVDFIEIIRVEYKRDGNTEGSKLVATQYSPIASFYRNDVKHYALV